MESLVDPVFLSRMQFAFTLAFHILFPTFTIGVSLYLVFLHWRFLRTDDHVYMLLFRFWLKLFALGFGVGVVSGIVLSFEFGTNFNEFSARAGNVLAPVLSYEVLTAFFLEASFLPILLFGWGRVGPQLHFFATAMVALGTVLSAFWILAANSWMQSPAGFHYEHGVFTVTNWGKAIFNPTFPYRCTHMLLAAALTTTFVVAGVSGWYLLRGRHVALSQRSLGTAIAAAAVLAPAQIAVGDLHGLETLRMQPMKIAAIEALWKTERYAPFLVFAIPDQAHELNHAEIGIPYGSSLILRHSRSGLLRGLTEVPPDERPPVMPVFFAFRVMVLIGFYLLIVAVAGLILRWRGRLYDSRWFLRTLVYSTPLGFLAVVAGWIVTEVGRQPWVVQSYIRTPEAATNLPWASVATSLALFVAVYHMLLIAFLYYFFRIVRTGPREAVPEELAASAPRTAWYPPPQEEER